MPDFWQSKTLKNVILGLAALLLVLVFFKLGLLIGARQADFSCRWGDNYRDNFAGPHPAPAPDFSGRPFMAASGIFGQIIARNGEALIVRDRDDMEKMIVAGGQVAIKRWRDAVAWSDLQTGEYVVVIGEPNQRGQIVASFIRVAPVPPVPPAAPVFLKRRF